VSLAPDLRPSVLSGRSPLQLALLLGPLLALGFAAGVLRGLSRRAGQAERRRRLLTAGWVALLFAGVPLWLFLATALRL